MPIRFEALEGAYLRDILNQPRAMRDTIAALEPDPALDALRNDLRAGRRRRIVLTGMGGSYQVLYPLHLRLIELGFDSILAETSELLYAMPALIDPQNAVVIVSQSGASAEIVRLLERRGPFYAVVTNTPGSPAAARADAVIMTQAGEEAGVSCKTAVTALAATNWLAAHLEGGGGALETVRRDLDAVPAAMDTYLSSWRDYVVNLVHTLAGVKHLFLAGRGSSMAAVGLGAMVQKEAAHFHGEGLGSAALRHGPFEMLGPDAFVMVYEGAPDTAELNRGLLRDALAAGARGALCGASAAAGPFAIPQVPESVRPILEMLPPQMISLALGYLGGREPGRFERITKITTVE
jgi:glutamine---fructose-6-phosphate transaminase (isomerizing)